MTTLFGKRRCLLLQRTGSFTQTLIDLGEGPGLDLSTSLHGYPEWWESDFYSFEVNRIVYQWKWTGEIAAILMSCLSSVKWPGHGHVTNTSTSLRHVYLPSSSKERQWSCKLLTTVPVRQVTLVKCPATLDTLLWSLDCLLLQVSLTTRAEIDHIRPCNGT